jgi:hypothetical protein
VPHDSPRSPRAEREHDLCRVQQCSTNHVAIPEPGNSRTLQVQIIETAAIDGCHMVEISTSDAPPSPACRWR